MKSRILLAVSALLGLALLASGCKPDYPKCETNEHCNEEGHTGVCVDGLCAECGTDADCKPGFKCETPVGGGNRCVPAAECSGPTDCSGGRVCKEGKCTACESSGECGPNAECDKGACRPKAECTTDGDCSGGKICVDNSCQNPPEAPRCNQGPVQFGFNEFSLSDSTRSSLQTLADCLKKTQTKAQVTIEGHADERGTEEFNMALGEKRANAVKKFLTGLGVQANRLRTVSYGEERPASRGSDEGAWASNRRAEFVVTDK